MRRGPQNGRRSGGDDGAAAGFEEAATYYVLLTWVYDTFNELPYLRLKGEFGTGKTRCLLTIGSLCYKPMFVSGAIASRPAASATKTPAEAAPAPFGDT